MSFCCNVLLGNITIKKFLSILSEYNCKAFQIGKNDHVLFSCVTWTNKCVLGPMSDTQCFGKHIGLRVTCVAKIQPIRYV